MAILYVSGYLNTWILGYHGYLDTWILGYLNFFSIWITDSQKSLDIQVTGYPSIRIPHPYNCPLRYCDFDLPKVELAEFSAEPQAAPMAQQHSALVTVICCWLLPVFPVPDEAARPVCRHRPPPRTLWVRLKFIYSEKATIFCKISAVDLSYMITVKSTVKILQNFVAFSEYMNFTTLVLRLLGS